MGDIVNEIIKGRKTFFIAPDRSLFPQSYLEDYLTLGYECYFIDTDIFLPVDVKVDIILSVFKDSILFFNIDAPIQNTTWSALISSMQKKYPASTFGVIYAKRQSETERHAIEKKYLYNIGIQGGCIQLEYQKRNNFELIDKMLYANQATGRRKNVRAVCTNSCKIQFISPKNGVINASLTDISISHFSFILPIGQLEIQDYEKIRDIGFTIKGLRFKTDAVLYMKRETPEGELFVMAFATKSEINGIPPVNKSLLVPKIYEIMMENCSELLDKLFSAATRIRKNMSGTEANLDALSDPDMSM